MKKITKVLVSITCLVLLTVFTTGCADKVDKNAIRQEQERMVEYTVRNYEDVKKIKFTSFKQNKSTRMWSVGAEINDDIYITYTVDMLGSGEIGTIFHVSESNEKKLKKKNNIENNGSTDTVEVHYWEG